MKLRLAVLISGGGTTLQNLLDQIHAGKLDASIECVISNKNGVRGLERAQKAGIPSFFVPIDKGDPSKASVQIFDICRQYRVELVVLGGFLALIEIPADFAHRVINIHPSLIPAFCGTGYYGLKVHQAVLDRGAKITGCTVHFVDDHYDHGPIILQKAVQVQEGDDAARLAERVFQVECEAYPEAIRLIANGRVHVEGGKVRIAGE